MKNADLAAAAPRWRLAVSVAGAWAAACSVAGLFAVVGHVLDAGLTMAAAAGMVVLGLAAAAMTGGGAWFAHWAATDTERRLRSVVLGRILASPTTSVETRSGWLLSLSTEAVERTAHYVAGFIGPIIGALTTPFVVLFVMALSVDASIAGWVGLCVVLVPLAVGGFQRLVRPIGAAYRREQSRLTAAFLEAIQALDTLVYARAAGRKANELAADGERHRRTLMKLLAGNQLLIFVIDAAFSLTVIVVAATLALLRVQAGTLSLGDGVAIVLMCTLVVGPVDVVGQFFYIGIGGRASRRQVAELLSQQSPGAQAEPTVTPGSRGPAISCESVTAGWEDGRAVLTDFCLEVARGERLALVGPSGVGKSTVSALVQAIIHPTGGRVLVEGMDTATTDSRLIRAQLAVIEQRAYLFHGTIADNLRLAAPAASDEDLWRALDVAGLADEVAAMTAGLNTDVGEQGTLLSGGQAQRVAIARVVLRDAPILILDEPTSNVDLAGEQAILAALARVAQGRTVIMIAHRPGAILAAHRVVELAPVEGRP